MDATTRFQTEGTETGIPHCLLINAPMCPTGSCKGGVFMDTDGSQDSAVTDTDPGEQSFVSEQKKDSNLREIINFLKHGILSEDNDQAQKIALQAQKIALQESLLPLSMGFYTLSTQSVRTANEQSCRNTFNHRSYVRHTSALMGATFQGNASTMHSRLTGGGKGCLVMP
jgi:hypothetical protein